MATNELLRFGYGELANIISYSEWKNLPEVTKGFLSGIAKSANMNRVFAQGALAGYVMGQAIVNLLEKDAKIESPTFYEDYMAALCKYIPGNVADGSIPTAKLAQLATYQDIENGVASKVVCADVLKQYLDTLVPTGACQCFLCKTAPTGWMELDGSQVDKEDAPDLVNLLWQFNLTKGDSTTYATLPNMNGRVFQGTTTVADVCKYLEASYPNSSRSGSHIRSSNKETNSIGSLRWEGNCTHIMAVDPSESMVNIIFDASISSNIYKTSSTVQPPALQVLPCIRI